MFPVILPHACFFPFDALPTSVCRFWSLNLSLHSYHLDVFVFCGCTYLDLCESHLVSYETFFSIRFVLMIILFMHHAYMYNDNTLILW